MLGVPISSSTLPFASLQFDAPGRSTALKDYPHLVVLLRCALRTTPSNSAVTAR